MTSMTSDFYYFPFVVRVDFSLIVHCTWALLELFFRQMNISEQVDHLLKQATSIDNLCNMYEGWTPWI